DVPEFAAKARTADLQRSSDRLPHRPTRSLGRVRLADEISPFPDRTALSGVHQSQVWVDVRTSWTAAVDVCVSRSGAGLRVQRRSRASRNPSPMRTAPVRRSIRRCQGPSARARLALET